MGKGCAVMKKVNVLLVGIGGYGTLFVEEILKNSNSAIELVGVVDPFPERCSLLEKLKDENVQIFSDMESFFKDNTADLAVISTPIFLHTKNILSALNNGCNALCEKPLCSDEKDIEILLEAQRRTGKFVYIGYQWSYSKPITMLKNDILANRFGALKEMKSLVLRPRTREYFGRGVGWAGKIETSDKVKVYDSIANNSAAHYLFNMLFVMGEYGKAAEPSNIKAELLRVNNIENFDVSHISFYIGNAKACFIGAHPVNRGIEPVFEYVFEKGTVYYSAKYGEEEKSMMPSNYEEYGEIVAIMNDGKKIVYGNPMKENCRKLYMAVDAIIKGNNDEGPCGICASSVHTQLINHIQREFKTHFVKDELIKEENNVLYADGLFEKLVESYKGADETLDSFKKEQTDEKET